MTVRNMEASVVFQEVPLNLKEAIEATCPGGAATQGVEADKNL